MSLLEYLEIVLTILEDINNNLNDYYNSSVFLSNRTSAMPIKLTIDNEGLALIIKERYRYYRMNKESTSKLHFHKSSLSNYYNVDDMDIYALKPEILTKAFEYANEVKKIFTKIQERKSFYNGFNRIIIEFNGKSQDEIIITYEYERYKSYYIYIDIDRRELITTDEFTIDLLKSIQVPDELIIYEIKEKLYSNNFPIHSFSDEELIWYPWSGYLEPSMIKHFKKYCTRRLSLW